MDVLEKLVSLAQSDPGHVVLPEGNDIRVARAAVRAVSDGIARVSVVADPEIFSAHTGQLANSDKVTVHQPATSPKRTAYAQALYERRKHRGMSLEEAEDWVTDNLTYAALMVHAGDADGTIGGAVATTADTLRAALQIIGKAEDTAIVSSFFLMALGEPHNRLVVFADCALVIEPDHEQLASIALSSARSYSDFVEDVPRVALLSFSTRGSADHESVDRVQAAVEIARDREPDLQIDGDLQFDAAFVPAVGQTKAPDSAVAGEANVFIFPNLNAGNIGYKIAQRIGGAAAIGPVIQGLNKPANDLSRGCSEEDVYQMIAVTSVQAARQRQQSHDS